MNEFKIYPKIGYDSHLKTTLRSFDNQVVIQAHQNHLIVKTKLSKDEISGFTSVDYVVDHSASPDKTNMVQDELEKPLPLDAIQSFIKSYIRNRSVSQYPDIMRRDLDGQMLSISYDINEILGWTMKWPTTDAGNPFVKLAISPATIGNDTIFMYYHSLKDKTHFGL